MFQSQSTPSRHASRSQFLNPCRDTPLKPVARLRRPPDKAKVKFPLAASDKSSRREEGLEGTAATLLPRFQVDYTFALIIYQSLMVRRFAVELSALDR